MISLIKYLIKMMTPIVISGLIGIILMFLFFGIEQTFINEVCQNEKIGFVGSIGVFLAFLFILIGAYLSFKSMINQLSEKIKNINGGKGKWVKQRIIKYLI